MPVNDGIVHGNGFLFPIAGALHIYKAFLDVMGDGERHVGDREGSGISCELDFFAIACFAQNPVLGAKNIIGFFLEDIFYKSFFNEAVIVGSSNHILQV